MRELIRKAKAAEPELIEKTNAATSAIEQAIWETQQRSGETNPMLTPGTNRLVVDTN